MLLPASSIRSGLKLNDAAQRLYWALNQLFGALPPATAVIASPANIAAGIPVNPANIGIPLTTLKLLPNYPAELAGYLKEYQHGYNFKIYLPLNLSQFSRGLALQKCVSPMVTDLAKTFVGAIPSGDPVVDGSLAATMEEYVVEQWMELQTNRLANSVTLTGVTDGFVFDPHGKIFNAFNSDSILFTGDYSSCFLPTLTLGGTILKKPNSPSRTLYTKPSVVSPWEVCNFSTYNTLAV